MHIIAFPLSYTFVGIVGTRFSVSTNKRFVGNPRKLIATNESTVIVTESSNHLYFSFQLLKDFEEDKQQAVSRATSSMLREIEKTKRQTEEKCKAEILDEMKKLQQKHKEAISQTKKKQWVR